MSSLPARISWPSRDRLDEVAAVGGLVVALALLPLGLLTSEVLVKGIPVALGLGCLAYLLSTVPRGRRLRFRSQEYRGVGFLGRRALSALVAVGLAGMVLVAVAAGRRSLLFLGLAGLVGTLLFGRIAFAEESALDHRSLLVAVVAYAAVVRFAGLLTTPGLIGIDTWTHVTSYAAAVGAADSLSALSGIKYVTAPLYHLIAVSASDVLGLGLREALYLTVGAAMPLSVLGIYAATRYVTTVRWALLATLLFAVSEYVVQWGLVVATTSLGLAFFLVVVVALVRVVTTGAGRADYVLLGAVAVAVTLTHQMSSFVVLAVTATALVATLLVRRIARGGGLADPGRARGLAAVFAGHLAVTLGLWAVTPWRGEPFLTRAVELLSGWLTGSAGFLNLVDTTAERVTAAAPPGPAAQVATAVDSVGFLLFFLLTVVGCLVLLRRSGSTETYTLVGTVGVMLVMAFGLPLFGLRVLLPTRWLTFLAAPMAIVGAVGVGHLARRLPARGVVACLVVLALAFPGTMLAAEKATMDEPTFEQQWPQYAYSAAEIDAAETVRETVPAETPVYTDHPYYTVVNRIHQDPQERSGAADGRRAYMVPLTADLAVESAPGPVVYREYQSTGRPTFDGPGVATVTTRLSAEQVCPPGRNRVFATDGVRMCTPGL